MKGTEPARPSLRTSPATPQIWWTGLPHFQWTQNHTSQLSLEQNLIAQLAARFRKTDALVTESLENKAHLNATNAKRAVVRAVARAVEMESDAQSSPADSDLIAVIASWATLPAAIKVGIMAMVGATTP